MHAVRAIRHRQSGFTLLELLVVMFIVALIIGTVTINADFGGLEQQRREEGQRLKALIELASEQALLHSRDYGLSFDEQGYGFFSYSSKTRTWQPAAGGDDEDPLRYREFAELSYRPNLSINVQGFDGQALNNIDEQDPDKFIPQIWFLASGEVTPFTIELRYNEPDSQITITSDTTGHLENRYAN